MLSSLYIQADGDWRSMVTVSSVSLADRDGTGACVSHSPFLGSSQWHGPGK